MEACYLIHEVKVTGASVEMSASAR